MKGDLVSRWLAALASSGRAARLMEGFRDGLPKTLRRRVAPLPKGRPPKTKGYKRQINLLECTPRMRQRKGGQFFL